MKDMRVEVKISTYPLLSDELPESIMFPLMRTSPLTLLHHTPQLPASHVTSLYATSYLSVALMIKKVPQFTLHLTTAAYHPEPHGFCTAATIQSIYTICNDLEDEEEDFQTVALDDEDWITGPVPDRHLCIHEHSQLHYLCPYPFPHSTDSVPTSYQDMLDLSDISDFENVMTISSDEDIPTLENVFEL